MSITSIQNVANGLGSNIMFINTEFSGNNRRIVPRRTANVGNCWIPWCSTETDFPAHHLEIIETNSGKVLWYIWQQESSDGDFVRGSTDGFRPTIKPAPAIALVGHSYNLWVDHEGVRTDDI